MANLLMTPSRMDSFGCDTDEIVEMNGRAHPSEELPFLQKDLADAAAYSYSFPRLRNHCVAFINSSFQQIFCSSFLWKILTLVFGGVSIYLYTSSTFCTLNDRKDFGMTDFVSSETSFKMPLNGFCLLTIPGTRNRLRVLSSTHLYVLVALLAFLITGRPML